MGPYHDVHRLALATGVTLAYAQGGPPVVGEWRTTVLLLHAWGESRRSFDRLVPLLPPTIRWIALDQRGHGDAAKPETGHTLDDLAADIESFLGAVGAPPVVLVGSSSGGYVAQQVALRSPELVAGLVLVGSPRSLHGRPPFADEVDRLTDPVDPAWMRESMTWFPMFHAVPEWFLEARVEDGLRIPAAVYRASLDGLVTARPPTEVGTITVPTLIVWGDRDELVTREDQEALAAAMPGSLVTVYEGVGHLVLWEQPERLASDLTAFVTSLPA